MSLVSDKAHIDKKLMPLGPKNSFKSTAVCANKDADKTFWYIQSVIDIVVFLQNLCT